MNGNVEKNQMSVEDMMKSILRSNEATQRSVNDAMKATQRSVDEAMKELRQISSNIEDQLKELKTDFNIGISALQKENSELKTQLQIAKKQIEILSVKVNTQNLIFYGIPL